MRILYVDIDTLRPDHLGCYGYPRATSTNIDKVTEDSVRFTDVYGVSSFFGWGLRCKKQRQAG